MILPANIPPTGQGVQPSPVAVAGGAASSAGHSNLLPFHLRIAECLFPYSGGVYNGEIVDNNRVAAAAQHCIPLRITQCMIFNTTAFIRKILRFLFGFVQILGRLAQGICINTL